MDTKNKEATFINTLSDNLDLNCNAVYTPLLKMAWNELKEKLDSPIIKIDSDIFNKIDKYKFPKEPLSEGEFKKKIVIENDNKIEISVEFSKSLPFKKALVVNSEPLLFNDKKVCAFSPKNEWCSFLYYDNEDDFAIRISTKEAEDEIVLIKSNFNDNFNIKDEIATVYNKKEQNTTRINYEDIITIPLIELNSSNDYSKLIPVDFYTENEDWFIKKLNQKIEFILDNEGAKVRSHLFMQSSRQAVPNKPKFLTFNKPFIVLLKKVNNNEPYFAMYVSNTDFFKTFSKELVEKINGFRIE